MTDMNKIDMEETFDFDKIKAKAKKNPTVSKLIDATIKNTTSATGKVGKDATYHALQAIAELDKFCKANEEAAKEIFGPSLKKLDRKDYEEEEKGYALWLVNNILYQGKDLEDVKGDATLYSKVIAASHRFCKEASGIPEWIKKSGGAVRVVKVWRSNRELTEWPEDTKEYLSQITSKSEEKEKEEKEKKKEEVTNKVDSVFNEVLNQHSGDPIIIDNLFTNMKVNPPPEEEQFYLLAVKVDKDGNVLVHSFNNDPKSLIDELMEEHVFSKERKTTKTKKISPYDLEEYPNTHWANFINSIKWLQTTKPTISVTEKIGDIKERKKKDSEIIFKQDDAGIIMTAFYKDGKEQKDDSHAISVKVNGIKFSFSDVPNARKWHHCAFTNEQIRNLTRKDETSVPTIIDRDETTIEGWTWDKTLVWTANGKDVEVDLLAISSKAEPEIRYPSEYLNLWAILTLNEDQMNILLARDIHAEAHFNEKHEVVMEDGTKKKEHTYSQEPVKIKINSNAIKYTWNNDTTEIRTKEGDESNETCTYNLVPGDLKKAIEAITNFKDAMNKPYTMTIKCDNLGIRIEAEMNFGTVVYAISSLTDGVKSMRLTKNFFRKCQED